MQVAGMKAEDDAAIGALADALAQRGRPVRLDAEGVVDPPAER